MRSRKIALISEILPKDMELKLRVFDVDIIRLSHSKHIKSSVATHPDILCCKTPKGFLFCDPSQKDVLNSFVEVKVGKHLENGYPNEVLYNCFFTDEFLFCSKYSDSSIVEYANQQGYKVIYVNQGYTKCSVAICGKNNFITADIGIYNALISCGYEVLLIDGDDILLEGYSYGFIGGCCGLLDENKLVFTGNIHKMKSGKAIFDFLNKIEVEPIMLSEDKLYDYGGIIII